MYWTGTGGAWSSDIDAAIAFPDMHVAREVLAHAGIAGHPSCHVDEHVTPQPARSSLPRDRVGVLENDVAALKQLMVQIGMAAAEAAREGD
jgi:hypothetical protein